MKWTPVHRRKCDKLRTLERFRDSTKVGSALAIAPHFRVKLDRDSDAFRFEGKRSTGLDGNDGIAGFVMTRI